MKRGSKHTPEALAKINAWWDANKHTRYGLKHSPEAIEKMRRAQLGRKPSKANKKASSEGVKASWRRKRRAVRDLLN